MQRNTDPSGGVGALWHVSEQAGVGSTMRHIRQKGVHAGVVQSYTILVHNIIPLFNNVFMFWTFFGFIIKLNKLI